MNVWSFSSCLWVMKREPAVQLWLQPVMRGLYLSPPRSLCASALSNATVKCSQCRNKAKLWDKAWVTLSFSSPSVDRRRASPAGAAQVFLRGVQMLHVWGFFSCAYARTRCTDTPSLCSLWNLNCDVTEEVKVNWFSLQNYLLAPHLIGG